MVKVISIASGVLLLPAFVACLGNLIAWISFGQAVWVMGSPYDPRLIAGELSSLVSRQLVDLIGLLPGIIAVSIASLKFYANQFDWFRLYVKAIAVMLIFTLPVFTVVGVYLLWLRRQKAFAPLKSVF